MSNMNKYEKKFGKYAIPNLTVILLLCYVAGYVMMFFNSSFLNYLTLDPYQILHGQIWRLVTWIVIPPSSLDPFVIILLLFYYSIGTALERTWGTWSYNVYLFRGILFTILAGFLSMGLQYLMYGEALAAVAGPYFAYDSYSFGTYYICLSIYMAYAATYPEARVLLMFIIPVKMKWMGIVNLVLLMIEFMLGGISTKFAVGAALLNMAVFYLVNIKRVASPRQIRRKAQFNQEIRKSSAQVKHKCAVCGRTQEDDPTLEFRYCSKCKGNYEYCQYHLFTHEHVQ
ncbi:MAG: hypothetical protein J6C84_10850 [Lachnospiraceae bacterium]|nr:hypothetical protein [Lachnospiraceae bacterium]